MSQALCAGSHFWIKKGRAALVIFITALSHHFGAVGWNGQISRARAPKAGSLERPGKLPGRKRTILCAAMWHWAVAWLSSYGRYLHSELLMKILAESGYQMRRLWDFKTLLWVPLPAASFWAHFLCRDSAWQSRTGRLPRGQYFRPRDVSEPPRRCRLRRLPAPRPCWVNWYRELRHLGTSLIGWRAQSAVGGLRGPSGSRGPSAVLSP